MTVTTREIRSADAEFQLLRALLTNRTKRHRAGRFLVHGVRSVNLAFANGWPVTSLLVSDGSTSRWAEQLVESAPVGEVVRLPAALVDELSQRQDGAEVIAVAEMRHREIQALEDCGVGPIVVAEGVQSPGNLGTILRSVASLGGSGVAVTGHAADPYDPACVRASTGALFSVPFVQTASVGDVVASTSRRTIGLDPEGEVIDGVDLSGPVLIVAGTESTGLSAKARAACDVLASIPMTEAGASLNVATAVAIALAEVARRRRMTEPGLSAQAGRLR